MVPLKCAYNHNIVNFRFMLIMNLTIHVVVANRVDVQSV